MKKILLVITSVLMFGIMQAYAQTFSVKDLIGTKWEQIKDYESNTKIIIEFTKTGVIETATFIDRNKTYCNSKPYYLSTTVPTSFKNSLVGKTTTGTYLVMLYKFDRMDYETIKKITSDSLVLYHRATNAIGGHEQTFVYKRIK